MGPLTSQNKLKLLVDAHLILGVLVLARDGEVELLLITSLCRLFYKRAGRTS